MEWDGTLGSIKEVATNNLYYYIQEFIGAVIGPGGKIIQQMQEDTGATITISLAAFTIHDILPPFLMASKIYCFFTTPLVQSITSPVSQ